MLVLGRNTITTCTITLSISISISSIETFLQCLAVVCFLVHFICILFLLFFKDICDIFGRHLGLFICTNL